MALSPEARERLCKLLPPTAFSSIHPSLTVDEWHPSQRHLKLLRSPFDANDLASNSEASGSKDAMQVDSPKPEADLRQPEHLDLSIFCDPHFESAARTFQVRSFAPHFE